MRTAMVAALAAAAVLPAQASAAEITAFHGKGAKADYAKMAGKALCPRRSVCLFSDADFRGKRIRYNCWGWAPGSVRSTKGDSESDATFRRNFPWNRDGGVSSYVNNGVPTAHLFTAHPEGGYGQPPLPMNSRDNLEPSNDLVTGLHMTC